MQTLQGAAGQLPPARGQPAGPVQSCRLHMATQYTCSTRLGRSTETPLAGPAGPASHYSHLATPPTRAAPPAPPCPAPPQEFRSIWRATMSMFEHMYGDLELKDMVNSKSPVRRWDSTFCHASWQTSP